MDPHDTTRPTRPDVPRATAPPTRTFGPQGPTLGDLIDAYLQDYLVRQFRSHSTARSRTAHLAAFFGRAARAAALTTHQIRQYQLARCAAGAATGTINRETSALHRMCTLAVHWGWLDTVPGFPDRLRENPPRQGFFEHPEYLAVRAHLPAPWQDILDLAYYSGWRKQEILGLTWDEIDEAGGVIRLSPARSKTLVGRILPISPPIAEALARRRARRDPTSPLVFHRDGSFRDPVGERRPFDQLQHERLSLIRLLDAVDGGDPRVVEAREHLRFPLEPGEAIRVSREGVGQDLQRDITAQLRVGGAIDLAHAALPDEGGHVVVPEPGADCEGHELSGNFRGILPIGGPPLHQLHRIALGAV